MTPEKRNQFVDKLMKIHNNKKRMDAIMEQRKAEEKAIIEEYKVDECNAKRNAMAVRYQDLIQDIYRENKIVEDELGALGEE